MQVALSPVAARPAPRSGSTPLRLSLVGAADPVERRRVERFIAQRYAANYGALLGDFLPRLVALGEEDGRLVGAAGFGPASGGPLFLERYLDRPIESALAASAGLPVGRSRVVEVGNLAAVTPGATRRLALTLTHLLADLGYQWVVFTATRQVRNALARCGLFGHDLGPARRAALGAGAARWGSYYEHDPRVIGGSLAHAARVVAGPAATPLPFE